jgi:hypothetical protein
VDFTTDDWVFNLDGKPKKEDLEPAVQVPYLANPKAWRQYTDDTLYEIDVLVRKWIAKCMEDGKWARSYRMRRYTFSMAFEQIYGRKYDQSKDAGIINRMSRVLAYYSSKIQKGGFINGKQKSKTIYTISPRRLKRPPYSLRLRLEWLGEQGDIPTPFNMRLPKDNLGPGHARNPRTEANMERRREDARARYRNRKGK